MHKNYTFRASEFQVFNLCSNPSSEFAKKLLDRRQSSCGMGGGTSESPHKERKRPALISCCKPDFMNMKMRVNGVKATPIVWTRHT